MVVQFRLFMSSRPLCISIFFPSLFSVSTVWHCTSLIRKHLNKFSCSFCILATKVLFYQSSIQHLVTSISYLDCWQPISLCCLFLSIREQEPKMAVWTKRDWDQTTEFQSKTSRLLIPANP